MKFVDTNVLIQLMTEDVPDLVEEAHKIVEASIPGELFIADAVIGELFFILEFNPQYRLPRLAIVAGFREIVATPQFQLAPNSLASFDLYARQPKLDFTDCLLLVLSGKRKAKLFTLDRHTLKLAM